jgi:hypothetical protein
MPNAVDTAMPMVCAWCRRRRDAQDVNLWLDVLPPGTPEPWPATYGICPDCCQEVINTGGEPSR